MVVVPQEDLAVDDVALASIRMFPRRRPGRFTEGLVRLVPRSWTAPGGKTVPRGPRPPGAEQWARMSLRSTPLEGDATLPDGRVVRVRVGVAEDDYLASRERRTVTLELYGDGEHLAALTTLLEPDQEDEARALLREVVAGLESGVLAPTAGALAPLVDTLR
jgi:hypothetical protein